MAEASARAVALAVLGEVLDKGRSLATALPEHLATLEPRERALAQELAYGTLRRLPRLEALSRLLLEKPLKPKDRDVLRLIYLGLYQLGHMNIAAHAAVSETVNLSKRLKKPWARGLINALLRRYQREAEALEAELDNEPVARYAHPHWLIEALRRAWPEQWCEVLEANNERPPMVLRANRLQGSRDEALEALAAAEIGATPHPHAEDGIVLDKPQPVDRLPGFDAGALSVQDGAAQLAASLLSPEAGERILDACAAPGGKTGHLLEHCPECEVTALELEPARLERVRENLDRIGLSARLVSGDAGKPDEWWDGQPFDRILLDAPCSATGVIRRNPDIKSLRRAEDIEALAATQARLLDALWPLLKPRGMLVYATCSVLPTENSEQVVAFLTRHPDAQELPIEGQWGRAAAAGRQILPGQDGMDGFYYACLVKA